MQFQKVQVILNQQLTISHLKEKHELINFYHSVILLIYSLTNLSPLTHVSQCQVANPDEFSNNSMGPSIDSRSNERDKINTQSNILFRLFNALSHIFHTFQYNF